MYAKTFACCLEGDSQILYLLPILNMEFIEKCKVTIYHVVSIFRDSARRLCNNLFNQEGFSGNTILKLLLKQCVHAEVESCWDAIVGNHSHHSNR
jgi:hypothetical protein